MGTKKKSGDSYTDTGGGTYIGGNQQVGGDFVTGDKKVDNSVSVGGNVTNSNFVTGDNNVVSNQVRQSQEGVTHQAFLELITQMQALVRDAGLEEHTRTLAESNLNAAQTEAGKDKPSSQMIVSFLKSLGSILEATDKITDKGGDLLEKVNKAIDWAGQLF